MTKATHRPLKRLVEGGNLGPLVVEVRGDLFTIRPYRCRKPLLEATYGEIARSVLLARQPKRKRRAA